jgi:hypothetical protein
MIAIPAVIDENGVLSPATSVEAVPNKIAAVCDGATYTVYQTGDALPTSVGS